MFCRASADIGRTGGTVLWGGAGIATKPRTGTAYFQVAATVCDAAVLERELKPLRSINDHYPKVLLTLDEDPDGDYDGIRKRNALQWLLDK
ncbi:MAG: hypothetical protein LBT74_12255 [Acidobacteriota bacterium]|jgi:hypothetical protein|nr:hypothetical protein [Acidobacteriota bacterium]